jgi:hypothetical protein
MGRIKNAKKIHVGGSVSTRSRSIRADTEIMWSQEFMRGAGT